MTRDEIAGVIIGRILQREGGIADIGDGKGVTSFGQTADWLRQFGLPTPATVADATANYRTWLVRTRLIGLCDVADSLPDIVIDYAVHSGHQTAIKALQKALSVAVDGVYGEDTQAAVDACDRRAIAQKALSQRIRFVGRLITDQPGRARWAAGWMNRLADQIEALA